MHTDRPGAQTRCIVSQLRRRAACITASSPHNANNHMSQTLSQFKPPIVPKTLTTDIARLYRCNRTGRIMFACRPFDVFDDLLARAFACSNCLSHVPLLSGYDEPRTLSYQIRLFGPIRAEVRQWTCMAASATLQITASKNRCAICGCMKFWKAKRKLCA